MSRPDFTSAKLRLARAKRHISEVGDWISHFQSTDFYKTIAEADQVEGFFKISFESLHEPNNEISAIIGDSIGNLRSVLDYLVVALIAPKEGESDRIYFPFAHNEAEFERRVRSNGCLGLSEESLQRYFIENIQAYRGGAGHDFWALNKLRNIDKHRFLVPVVQNAGIHMNRIDTPRNVFINPHLSGKAGNAYPVLKAPLGLNIKVKGQPRPTYDIFIHERIRVGKSEEIISLNIQDFLAETAIKIEELMKELKKGV